MPSSASPVSCHKAVLVSAVAMTSLASGLTRLSKGRWVATRLNPAFETLIGLTFFYTLACGYG